MCCYILFFGNVLTNYVFYFSTFYVNIVCLLLQFCYFFLKIIMHQSLKLTDAISLLHLVISSPLIHALGDQRQAPTGIRTRVLSRSGGWLTNWAIPFIVLKKMTGLTFLNNFIFVPENLNCSLQYKHVAQNYTLQNDGYTIIFIILQNVEREEAGWYDSTHHFIECSSLNKFCNVFEN